MGNKSFSFVIRCYNQEKYILQNLESIKYLCEKYGEGIDIHLFLCDDCSTDNSVLYARKWLEVNNHLFSKIVINVNEVNSGIVANQLKAMELVDTEAFKITDADDIYFVNNIFKTRESDIVCSPLILFENDHVFRDRHFENRFKLLCLHKDELFDYLRERINYDYIVPTPGIFFKRIIFNEVCRSDLSNYKWLDDVIQFASFMKNAKLNVDVDFKAYVLYRYNVGISTSTNNVNSNRGLEELQRINKDIFFKNKRSKLLQHLSSYYYKYSIEKRLLQLLYRHTNSDVKQFEHIFLEEFNTAQKHIDYINQKANEFFKLIND